MTSAVWLVDQRQVATPLQIGAAFLNHESPWIQTSLIVFRGAFSGKIVDSSLVYTKCTIHKIRHGTTHPQLTRIETGNHHNPWESHLQFRFFVLCLLGIPGPRSVWPAAPGIPSLLEHRPLRCKPLVPPSQFDPAEYDVIPHGAKSLGHGYRGFTSP